MVSWSIGPVAPVGVSGAGGNSYPRKFRRAPASRGVSGVGASAGSAAAVSASCASVLGASASEASLAGASASGASASGVSAGPAALPVNAVVFMSSPEQAAASSATATNRGHRARRRALTSPR